MLIVLSGCITDSSTLADTATVTDVATQIQQSSTPSNEALGSVITIGSARVIKHQNLTLRLVAVEDSRCATGVTCIWAGQLVVTLEVSNERAEKIAVKLIRKRESTVANAFGYSLLLLDVTPHPKKGKVIQLHDQIITLKIVKTSGV